MMNTVSSLTHHLFATTRTGGAISTTASDVAEARKHFRHLRNNPEVTRIRVARDDYHVGSGERNRVWLCDWERS